MFADEERRASPPAPEQLELNRLRAEQTALLKQAQALFMNGQDQSPNFLAIARKIREINTQIFNLKQKRAA